MKNLILGFAAFLLSVGCTSMQQQVDFQFVNLSTNEIHSDEVVGMPGTVGGGWLPPRLNEEHIDGTVSLVGEAVHVRDRIKIVWQEGGSSRATELKRSELGLPTKLKSGKIRFTYLGDGKWRVKLFE